MGMQNVVAKPRIWAHGLFLLAVLAALTFFPVSVRAQGSGTPQPAAGVVQSDVKLVIGGETIKNNSKVTLSVVGSSLQVSTGKVTVAVPASSILDISTNEDSRQDITGAAQVATMAIPYGGSRVLSLFSHQVDVLTLEYTDSDGGYHGTIFVLAKGQAAPIKQQLVALGAKATVPLEAAQTNK